VADFVRFSFALSARMQSYLMLRDALRCLTAAESEGDAYRWLHAAIDLRASLLGDQARKIAIPEVHGLLTTTQTHLQGIAKEHPQYADNVREACDSLSHHMQAMQEGVAEACNLLGSDALVNAYLNTQKKQDWLGHKPSLPQALPALWQQAAARTEALSRALDPLAAAVEELDGMLHDFVGWDKRTAAHGTDQIIPPREQAYGLLVIALPTDVVAAGLLPEISGNRHAIRLRFQRWKPGQPPADVTDDHSYMMMLVPIA